jgi:hypothetical protein
VEQVAAVQLVGESVDFVERGLCTEHLTERDGPVQPDHRRGLAVRRRRHGLPGLADDLAPWDACARSNPQPDG